MQRILLSDCFPAWFYLCLNTEGSLRFLHDWLKNKGWVVMWCHWANAEARMLLICCLHYLLLIIWTLFFNTQGLRARHKGGGMDSGRSGQSGGWRSGREWHHEGGHTDMEGWVYGCPWELREGFWTQSATLSGASGSDVMVEDSSNISPLRFLTNHCLNSFNFEAVFALLIWYFKTMSNTAVQGHLKMNKSVHYRFLGHKGYFISIKQMAWLAVYLKCLQQQKETVWTWPQAQVITKALSFQDKLSLSCTLAPGISGTYARCWLKNTLSHISIRHLDSPSHLRGTQLTWYLVLSVRPLASTTKDWWCEQHETPYPCFEDEIFSRCSIWVTAQSLF